MKLCNNIAIFTPATEHHNLVDGDVVSLSAYDKEKKDYVRIYTTVEQLEILVDRMHGFTDNPARLIPPKKGNKWKE